MGYSIYILSYVPTIKPCTALLINLLSATETKQFCVQSRLKQRLQLTTL